ncbi:MAG: anion permease [Firmicutes bacterium]|nr:anion permease [Bacillota bacterium]
MAKQQAVAAGNQARPAAADRGKLIRALIVLAVGGIIWFLPPIGGLEPAAMHLTAIFVATILGLILQPLPQGAVVLLGVAITAITGTLSIGDTMKGFSDATVWLIVSAFLFARGFIKTGLGRRIAYLLVRRFGKSTLGLGYALAFADVALAPATPSNTARGGGILFPVIRSLASSLGSEPGPTARRIGAYLMFNGFVICQVTSALFLTGVAPNSLIVKLAKENFDYTITWMGWFWAALVPGLVSVLAMPYLVFKLFDPELKRSPEAPEMARKELEKMGPMTLGEKGMLAVFLLTLLLWATGQWTNINATAVALGGVATLLVLGVIEWQDVLSEKGAWDALAWFGGLVGLASGLSKLKVIDVLATWLKGSLGGVSSWTLGFLLVVLAYVFVHYFIASMTAHATAFYVPLALVAISLGAPAPLVLLVLGFMNSLNATTTHYGSGPAPVFFGSGYIDQATWWRCGLIVCLANLAIWLTVGSVWWKVIGLW